MRTESIEQWVHDHTFGQDEKKSGERRTLIVIGITAVTMLVEIIAGVAFGSMALLADGLHMGSHTSALAISAFAYYYTRRHARDERFNFGTGKVNSLAAFASAIVLVVFAAVMAWESTRRFIHPVGIDFTPAIAVAVIGLIVNGVCIWILGGHAHPHGKLKSAKARANPAQEHPEDEEHTHDHDLKASAGADREDHNLRSAYLHVFADALTSLLAVAALVAGKYLGQVWLDPFMGIIGAVLVVRWSVGLIKDSARVLLDMQAPEEVKERIRHSVESDGDCRISDLHVWAVGPGIYAAEIAVVASHPLAADEYLGLLPKGIGLVHVTIETHRYPSPTLEKSEV